MLYPTHFTSQGGALEGVDVKLLLKSPFPSQSLPWHLSILHQLFQVPLPVAMAGDCVLYPNSRSCSDVQVCIEKPLSVRQGFYPEALFPVFPSGEPWEGTMGSCCWQGFKTQSALSFPEQLHCHWPSPLHAHCALGMPHNHGMNSWNHISPDLSSKGISTNNHDPKDFPVHTVFLLL